ncbi:MAG: hypothetical protein M5U28_08505 [Sandaracinaceae bacterium]|nr:hypothetical protein [Sandaracinaceae bacterium]
MKRTSILSLGLAITGCTAITSVHGLTFDLPDAGQSDGGLPRLDGGRDAGLVDAGETRDSAVDASGGLPDLTIACVTPAEIEGPGELVRVAWAVGNIGARPATPFDVAAMMEQPPMTAGEVSTWVEVGTARRASTTAPMDEATGDVAFLAPSWIASGTNAIRCVVDPRSEVMEEDESNNTHDTFLRARGLPELRPLLSTMDRDGATRELRYSFWVVNDGATAARDVSWRVIAEDTSAGDQADVRGTVVYVGAGEQILVSGVADISAVQAAQFGPVSVAAIVDYTGEIDESNEANNRVDGMTD